MESILINGVCDYIVLDGRKIPIATSFRLWLRYFYALHTKNEILMVATLSAICPGEHITEKLIEKLKEYALPADGNKTENDNLTARQQEVFDLFMDEYLVISDFLREYNIDLLAPEYDMHWITFKILLDNLSNDSAVSARINLRGIDIRDVGKKQRAQVRRLKKKYHIQTDEKNKITLAERNNLWQDYINKRMSEVRENG